MFHSTTKRDRDQKQIHVKTSIKITFTAHTTTLLNIARVHVHIYIRINKWAKRFSTCTTLHILCPTNIIPIISTLSHLYNLEKWKLFFFWYFRKECYRRQKLYFVSNRTLLPYKIKPNKTNIYMSYKVHSNNTILLIKILRYNITVKKKKRNKKKLNIKRLWLCLWSSVFFIRLMRSWVNPAINNLFLVKIVCVFFFF